MTPRVSALLPAVGVLAAVLAACISNPSLGRGDEANDAGTADATEVQGALPTADASPAGTTAVDSGNAALSCDQVLARMLGAPVVPPSSYAGLDLARGKNPKGLTVDEANAAGCLTFGPDTPIPGGGGYREAYWRSATDDISLLFNVSSRVIYDLTVGRNYTGTVRFDSRAGGPYGTHTYELGIGRLLRDGADMPIDWGASSSGYPWANELFDAMLAAFSPNVTPSSPQGCVASRECLVVSDDGAGYAFFGMRNLAFYLQFPVGAGKPSNMYSVWKGGRTDCTTPVASVEAMDYAPIVPGQVNPAPEVPLGGSLGGLDVSKPAPGGLTWQAANALACNGTAVPAPDPGYDAIAWGPAGELALEYNRSTSLAYKLIARSGYKGTLDAQTYAADGVTVVDRYSIGIGTLTKNGAPFAIPWASPTATVTELSNAIHGTNDTDCVTAARCTITANDGTSHAIIDFPLSLLTVVFATSTSSPVAIYTTWPNGKN